MSLLFWLSPAVAMLLWVLLLLTSPQSPFNLLLLAALSIVYPGYYLTLSSFVLNRKRFFLQILYATVTTLIITCFYIISGIVSMSFCEFYYEISDYGRDTAEASIIFWHAGVMLAILLIFAIVQFIRLKILQYYKEKQGVKT